MKILCVIDSLGSGGAQRQLVTLAKLFKQRGDEVRFLTYAPYDFFLKDLADQHIPVYTLPPASYAARIYKIRKYIRRGDQDVVLSFLDTPNFLSCLAAVGGKKWKLIISERSNKEEYFKGWRYKLQKYFARYADAIVCNSVSARKVWEKFYPHYSSKLHVVYNTVVVSPVQTVNQPLKNKKLKLLVAASYQYLKNMDGLIEGLSFLSEQEKQQIQIDWYGSRNVNVHNISAYEEALRKKQQYDLDSVLFLKEVSLDIHKLMSEADCVGLFSKWEGLPNTICEAMKLGKPILMTKVSDYDVLVGKDNGFLCESENPLSIRDSLRELLSTSPETLEKMGQSSKNKADKLFDDVAIMNKWESIFKR